METDRSVLLRALSCVDAGKAEVCSKCYADDSRYGGCMTDESSGCGGLLSFFGRWNLGQCSRGAIKGRPDGASCPFLETHLE